MTQPAHVPVLLDGVIRALSPGTGECYADATAGLGGHAVAIARLLGPTGTVVLNDVDPGNLMAAEGALRGSLGRACPVIHSVTGNFADLPRRLAEMGVAADMLLADLGFSSNQMADAGRGLSFMSEGPLDMRLDPGLPTSAADLVRTLPVAELARILSEYGQERHAGAIARKLGEARAREPITTTFQLAQIVRSVLARRGPSGEGIDPATRTFQALRIAVNDELGVLESLLESVRRATRGVACGSAGWLRAGGRVGIISFHSLEDRLVKRAFADLVREGMAEPAGGRSITAEEDELASNRRARSARLRAIRVGPPSTDGGSRVDNPTGRHRMDEER